MNSLIISSVTSEAASPPQQLSPSTSSYIQLARRERDEAMADRDRLFNILERRSLEVERLESELTILKTQLESAITAKCESLTKSEDLQTKVREIEFKERRMASERQLLGSQVEMLEGDLRRNIDELKQCRTESSSRILSLEGRLHEKCEELSIAVMQSSQLKETNENLTARVEELSRELREMNENFSNSIKKYQNELNSKERLVDLYKDKNDDCVGEQRELTNAITEVQQALKEATEEYGKLETKLKSEKITHENHIEALNGKIRSQANELKNANHLLEALRTENIEISIEKQFPSAKRARHSISDVYSMYVHTNEDFEQLTVEHEQLKSQFSQVVDEIKDKAPTIHRNQVELSKLKDAHAELMADFDRIKLEKFAAYEKIEVLVKDVEIAAKNIKDLHQERFDLSHQVCNLLSVVENRQIYKKRGDFINENLNNFKNIEELQENNMKLVKVVRELSAAVEELEKSQENHANDTNSARNPENITKIASVESNNHGNHQNELQIALIESKAVEIEATTQIDLKQTPKSSKINSDSTPKSSNQSQNQSQAQNEHCLSESHQTIAYLTENLQKLQSTLNSREKSIDTLKSQLDTVRSQHNEVSSLNYKLKSQIDHQDSQLKLQQKNFDSLKRKTQSLEDKSRNSSSQSGKLEVSLSHLREELKNTSSRLSHAENQIEKLIRENKSLIRNEAHLKASNESLQKTNSLQAHMMSSIELIRSSMERIESEGSGGRLSEKLREMTEKCEKLEKQLSDEKNNMRDFEAQAGAEIEQFESENKILNETMIALNYEVEAKNNEIIEKDAQIQQNDAKIVELSSEITDLNTKINDLNAVIADSNSKIAHLTTNIEKLSQSTIKSMKDEEVQSDSSTDSDQTSEVAKLKENVSQLRKIGKRYKEQYLELKSQMESASANDEIENLKKKNCELTEALTREDSMKNLLTKARGMITKLSEEKEQLNEELKKQKDEFDAKINESNASDFLSCVASSSDLKSVDSMVESMKVNEITENITKSVNSTAKCQVEILINGESYIDNDTDSIQTESTVINDQKSSEMSLNIIDNVTKITDNEVSIKTSSDIDEKIDEFNSSSPIIIEIDSSDSNDSTMPTKDIKKRQREDDSFETEEEVPIDMICDKRIKIDDEVAAKINQDSSKGCKYFI